MKSRIKVAIALAALSFPLLGFGLLDPLEGLPALILGLAALIAARLITRVKIPKIAWISLLITIILLAVTLLIISLEMQAAQLNAEISTPVATTVGNALGGPAGWLLWASRVTLVTTLVGIGLYPREIIRAFRGVSKEKEK